MARSRGAKKGYEAESLAKLFVPQAASAEQARGSHQYRAIHRDCGQEPELASRVFHPIYQYERFRNRALRLINRPPD
jgi:hypothetical protein